MAEAKCHADISEAGGRDHTPRMAKVGLWMWKSQESC